MIWYDVDTKAPVAPGSCEDSGIPSIESYQCKTCGYDGLPQYQAVQVDFTFQVARCQRCKSVLLTTVL